MNGARIVAVGMAVLARSSLTAQYTADRRDDVPVPKIAEERREPQRARRRGQRQAIKAGAAR